MADSIRNHGNSKKELFEILDKRVTKPSKNSDKTSTQAPKDFFVLLDEFQANSQRCDMFTLEYPVFSLSRIPSTTPLHFGQFIISPNALQGQPTMYDKELLIYVVSKLVAAQNQGHPIGRLVRFTGYDFLKFTGKGIGGQDYQRLHQALKRISSCHIEHVTKTDNIKHTSGFTLFNYEMVEDSDKAFVQLELHPSLLDAIQSKKVLRLSDEYLQLSPLERRLYELARKHCGTQKEWAIGIESLHDKIGSTREFRFFKADFKKIAQENLLPDYHISFNQLRGLVTFTPKKGRSIGNSK